MIDVVNCMVEIDALVYVVGQYCRLDLWTTQRGRYLSVESTEVAVLQLLSAWQCEKLYDYWLQQSALILHTVVRGVVVELGHPPHHLQPTVRIARLLTDTFDYQWLHLGSHGLGFAFGQCDRQYIFITVQPQQLGQGHLIETLELLQPGKRWALWLVHQLLREVNCVILPICII